ncbi:acetyl-CoA hydrolase/transferase family protein [Planococcus beigongshangi]|uniref:acetyl-CoA hydrolase/transferase family protein n=1 Tax=Planococcus beigongshangi TaxID=2782536 RepID=UPI00193B27E9|nr:acetyl-CoA hydrolase/transferase family protein [Planococcus beigongshangi]
MDKRFDRIKAEDLQERVVSAEEAASWIGDGMTLGLSGFTQAGDAKAVPLALAKRAETETFKVNVFTGASLGSNIDTVFAEAGIVRKRLPFQSDPVMRRKINAGEIFYTDHHLSHTAEWIRDGLLTPIDFAIIEAISITKDGMIIPTTSVGNSAIFVKHARNVIVEINTEQPERLYRLHDIYDTGKHEGRQPIYLTHVADRVGTTGIPVDPDKIRGIVFTDQVDSPSKIMPPDGGTEAIASHLLELLRSEIRAGRLSEKLAPLQSGVGSVANSALHGLIDSEFHDLEMYSEVLQDAVFDLIDADKLRFASGSAITLSPEKMKQVYSNFGKYEDKIVLRPQEITNHPGIIRRLGLIAVNTALEFDIYGNVNSTHVSGTKMMNGIGGSGDFARNARLSIFVTKATAKNGTISSVVPFVTHVDHTEHDVDVLITEFGYADLRGLAPRERAALIIENCADPAYREQLRDYYAEALTRGGQTPHVLEKAFSWHQRLANTGSMLED